MRQEVDSLAQRLEHGIFIQVDRIDFFFSSFASFLCYNFHEEGWGLIRHWTLLRRKWLCVIINDDFLEEGECYGLSILHSITCLGRFRIACRFIFNLWRLRQGVDFLAQWLEHRFFAQAYRFWSPWQVGIFFFQLCFIPMLRHSYRRIRVRPEMTSPHHKWFPWRGVGGGGG